MVIYYAVLDYCGWCCFSNLGEGDFKFWFESEPFYYASVCRDNVVGICKILNNRRKYL